MRRTLWDLPFDPSFFALTQPTRARLAERLAEDDVVFRHLSAREQERAFKLIPGLRSPLERPPRRDVRLSRWVWLMPTPLRRSLRAHAEFEAAIGLLWEWADEETGRRVAAMPSGPAPVAPLSSDEAQEVTRLFAEDPRAGLRRLDELDRASAPTLEAPA